METMNKRDADAAADRMIALLDSDEPITHEQWMEHVGDFDRLPPAQAVRVWSHAAAGGCDDPKCMNNVKIIHELSMHMLLPKMETYACFEVAKACTEAVLGDDATVPVADPERDSYRGRSFRLVSGREIAMKCGMKVPDWQKKRFLPGARFTYEGDVELDIPDIDGSGAGAAKIVPTCRTKKGKQLLFDPFSVRNELDVVWLEKEE